MANLKTVGVVITGVTGVLAWYNSCSVAVISLVSEEIRDKQLAGEIQQPYQKIVTYETTEYDDLTVEKAYEYLKTLPEFEGAEDILEEKHNLS